MPSTPNLALPYPSATDTADVPRDIQALADKLDLNYAAVSTLPASPANGQECFYLADATNGVIWHLRYRSASGSPYKWEFVGGAELQAEVEAAQTTTTPAVFQDLATVGPQVVTPLAGDYIVTVACHLNTSTVGVSSYMSPQFGAVAPTVPDGLQYQAGVAGQVLPISRPRKKTITTASVTVCAKYAADAGTATFSKRVLTAVPTRVG